MRFCQFGSGKGCRFASNIGDFFWFIEIRGLIGMRKVDVYSSFSMINDKVFLVVI
jgi:hypothetical protein